MSAHRKSVVNKVADRKAKKVLRHIEQPDIGDPPSCLSPMEAFLFIEIVEDNPHGVTLTKSDRHMVEIAARLLLQDRAGIIKTGDRGQLRQILKDLGRSPMDRHHLGLSDDPDPDVNDEFTKFLNK
jgi:hypothetical protein